MLTDITLVQMVAVSDETPRDNRAAQALRGILKGRKQSELAAETGISQAHLSRLAAGKRVAQSRSDALALKHVLGIELEWWDEPPLPEESRTGEDAA